MFYLVDSKGNFLSGFVPAGSRGNVMFEGQLFQGEPKITKRLEDTARSTHEAWEFLCERVAEARANGFQDKPIDTSKLFVPAEIYQAEFPLVLRSVYARVNAITADQFSAGLARLSAIHQVLPSAGVSVVISGNEKSVELRLGKNIIRFGFVSERLWETMTTKARELSSARGLLDDNELLPDGRGLFHLRTRETCIDLYVRAFLHGATQAGASIEWSSDHPWKFQKTDPFSKADVKDLQWYRDTPDLHGEVLKLDQTIPVQTTTVMSAVDFYC